MAERHLHRKANQVMTRTRSLGLLGSALTLSAIVLSAAIGAAEGPGGTAEGSGFGQAQPAQAPDGARIYKERCATCHDAPDVTTRSPGREQLRVRSVAQIIASLDPGGVMAAQGQPLSPTDKQAVAAYISGATSATGATGAASPAGVLMAPAAPLGAAAVDPSVGACAPSMINSSLPSLTSQPMWNGWGNDLANTRFQPTTAAGLTVSDVPKLTLKWAFGFAGTSASSGQPTIAGGRVFVGNTKRIRIFARRQHRMHLLVLQGRRGRAHGGQRRRYRGWQARRDVR